MSKSESVCDKCGKPKEKSGAGFVTQFIDVCHCESLPEDDNSRIELCEECGKRVERGRAGSFTQWIFRAEICSCKNPKDSSLSIDTSENSRQSTKSDKSILDEAIEEEDIEAPPGSLPEERYRAKALLGEGAAGRVYLCVDQHLEKKVAVKSLHQLTPEHLVSFQAEAMSMSKLNHPNIVKILDFGATDSGFPFMVMDFVNGVSLATILEEQGSLDTDEAINICIQMCDALAHSHSLGIYHRDIKPSNILILRSKEGLQVRLIDFGVAMVKESTLKPTMIGDEAVVGTPAYMSPDQIKGNSYDGRSEIYSLGCVLFEALNGKPPFVGENAMKTLYMHSNDPPPPLMLDDSRKSKLEALIHKMLAKNSAERFDDIRQLKEDLLSLGADDQQSSMARKPEKGRNFLKVALTVSLVAVAYFGFVIFQNWKTRNAVLTGTAYHSGADGFKQDYKQALKWWLIAAERGDAEAENNIGTLYMFGQGVPVDYKKALYWLRLSSAHGNLQAKSNLGILYMKGQGVKRNDKKAFRLTQKAAEAGIPLAENNLGYMYLKGRGVKVNYKKALRWIDRGVENGDAYALYHKGYMYEKGLGLPKSKKKAILFYRKAVAKNLDRARVRLNRLTDEVPNFEKLLETTPKQLK